MNYEEEIQLLNERITKLETLEKKRQVKRKINIIFNLIKLLILLIISIMIYNYTKPYIEKIENTYEEFNSVENYIKEKLNILNNSLKENNY